MVLDKEEEEEEENLASKKLIKEVMNEAVEARASQPDTEAGLQSTTTEMPRRDPEAIAKYEADYPDLVKDPVLARLIAAATDDLEMGMRDQLKYALSSAKKGRREEAEAYIKTASEIAAHIEGKSKLIKEIYDQSRQILDGKPPTSTENINTNT